MNAIIIAAGSGKRISNDVKNIPKSMVKFELSIVKSVTCNNEQLTGPCPKAFN